MLEKFPTFFSLELNSDFSATNLDTASANGKISNMKVVEDWFDVAGEVLSGRTRQTWKGVHPSADAWMRVLAAERGRSAATLRRWAAGRRFIETVAGQRGFPTLDVLCGMPFALVEQLVTLHRLDPEGAADRARAASEGGVTMRTLREDAHRIAAPRRATAKRHQADEQKLLLRGLGEPDDLLPSPWPSDLALAKPDGLLANAERIVAIGLIGAGPDAASAARVSWAVAVSGLVDAVWLVGPAGGTFPRAAHRTLELLGAMANRVGVAVVQQADPGGVMVLRHPAAGPPQPDFRALIRGAVAARGHDQRGGREA